MRFMNWIERLENFSSCRFFNILYQKAVTASNWLRHRHISPNMITLTGLLFAILGLNFLAMEYYFLGLMCLLANRLADILDGITARHGQLTAFGAFLDIFADYTSTAMFIWGFILAVPAQNAVAGAFLLVTVTVSAAALLGFTAVSGQNYRRLNRSGFRICAWGTIQNFDTFIALFVMCLLPRIFMPIAIFFGLLSIGKSLLIVSGAYYTLVIAAKGKRKNENL